ncbi:MAG: hypothetical protein U1C51_08905 [Candidatus Izemoplasmatales bacterium]|jgi:hypothetical protein|nr:hypothetical protein [Candidatus Izemoplasmatales bacterium]
MYELLIGLYIFAVITFVFLSFIDRELRFLEKSNIRKVKFIELKKANDLFFKWMKKDKSISEFSFFMILSFYAVNVLGVATLVLHLITQVHVLWVLCAILLFLNLPILLISLISVSLSKDEQRHKNNLQKK